MQRRAGRETKMVRVFEVSGVVPGEWRKSRSADRQQWNAALPISWCVRHGRLVERFSRSKYGGLRVLSQRRLFQACRRGSRAGPVKDAILGGPPRGRALPSSGSSRSGRSRRTTVLEGALHAGRWRERGPGPGAPIGRSGPRTATAATGVGHHGQASDGGRSVGIARMGA